MAGDWHPCSQLHQQKWHDQARIVYHLIPLLLPELQHSSQQHCVDLGQANQASCTCQALLCAPANSKQNSAALTLAGTGLPPSGGCTDRQSFQTAAYLMRYIQVEVYGLHVWFCSD